MFCIHKAIETILIRFTKRKQIFMIQIKDLIRKTRI